MGSWPLGSKARPATVGVAGKRPDPPPPGRPPPGLAFGPPGRSAQKRRGRRRGRPGPSGRPRARAYPVGRRLGHGCPSLSRSSSRRPVGPGAARWRRRRRSGAAQPRSPSPAAASCVRATCPAGPLNKSCARGPARGHTQRPLQPEGPHAPGRSLASRRPRGPPRGRATQPRLGRGSGHRRAGAGRVRATRRRSSRGPGRPRTRCRMAGLREPSVPPRNRARELTGEMRDFKTLGGPPRPNPRWGISVYVESPF